MLTISLLEDNSESTREEILTFEEEVINTQNSSDYNPSQIRAIIKTYRARSSKHNTESQFIPGTFTYIARYNQKLIGVVSGYVNHSSIVAAFVERQYSRRGIGSMLLKEAEEYLGREDKDKYIWVLSSKTASKFYKKNGYKILVKSVKTAQRFDVILMGKPNPKMTKIETLTEELKLSSIAYIFNFIIAIQRLMEMLLPSTSRRK